MIKIALILLAALQMASAARNDVYAFTLFANDDVDGKCQEKGIEIGDGILATFGALVPGFTPYEGSVRARFLRTTDRDLQTTINMCARSYCDKPANYDACIWNGCNCSCGRGRELLVSASGDNAKVALAKKLLDERLAVRGTELGCQLFLELKKVRG